ncbi:hypothetical protein Sjap_024796 [Stephania japonica]|uniref:Protein kinase domain-containing protein n=1 Tax=Stephania japonica TaxID=461633 RepID=A0AAP0HLV0_9MAGN
MDHSMCAKVADFGFSKYAPQEGDSGVSLEVRGTAGYLDPEYACLIGGLTCVLISVGVCPVWAGEELHNLVATNLEKLGEFCKLILRVGSPITAASSFAIHGRE